MAITWVLAADASRARLFNCTKPGNQLHEFATLTHPASRLKDAELGSAEPSVTFERAGHGRHAMVQATAPKAVQTRVFAREVAEQLKRDHQQNCFQRLVVIAAPKFLGELRNNFAPSLNTAVVLEIDKDVSHMPVAGIQRQLPEFF